jgi:hypothetical protein
MTSCHGPTSGRTRARRPQNRLLLLFLPVLVGTAARHGARDLVHRIPVVLVPEDDLETALHLCEANQEEHMPVVDNPEGLHVIGEVRYQDLVLAYSRACSPPRRRTRRKLRGGDSASSER